MQLTTDGHKAYLEAVEGAFGDDVDCAQLVKLYGSTEGEGSEKRYSPAKCTGIRKWKIEGSPDPANVSTSCVERHNLTMRMGMRRFTRLTNAFSKKLENHLHMLSLYFMHYNFCRVHKSLRMSPAMAAGVSDTLKDMEWIVGLIDARAPKPKRPTTYRKRVSNMTLPDGPLHHGADPLAHAPHGFAFSVPVRDQHGHHVGGGDLVNTFAVVPLHTQGTGRPIASRPSPHSRRPLLDACV